MKKFEVNDQITLKLEDGKTNIYVKGVLFEQCKFLLLNIPIEDISSFEEIKSVDEAAEKLDKSLEINKSRIISIPPETKFWGHCSNLQVWVENEYKTNILHRSIAFPLLKKLVEVGDIKAKKVFKEEIAQRILSNHFPTVRFLIEDHYLKYLTYGEIKTLIYEGFERKKTGMLYLLFEHGYFKWFKNKEIVTLFDEYYIKNRVKKNQKLNELFQRIAISQIKRQFPSEDEVHFGYEKSLLRQGKITSLEIRLSRVKGKEFDMEDIFGLKYLTGLERLVLRNLNISKICQLEELKELRILHLSNCNLSEIKGLSMLKNLEELNLSYNQITEIRGLSDIKKLEKLKLNHNKIIVIEKLENLTNLKFLDLSYNKITKISGLETLKKLESLNLRKNQIKQISGIDKLINMRELNLSSNQIQEIRNLNTLKHLKALDLSYNKIEEVKNLDCLESLKILRLYHNKIHSSEYIDKIKHGKMIGISGNPLNQNKKN